MPKEVFGGLSLAGGKRRGTSLVLLSLNDRDSKLAITEIFGNLGSTATQSADQVLLRVINKRGDHPSILGINAPLSLPPCITCQLPWCPGHENCKVNSIEWMRDASLRLSKIHKNAKKTLPYTERPVEIFLRENLPYWLDVPGAYGANISPLAARVQYLKRHISLETKLIEVLPRLTFHALASGLDLSDESARYYKEPEDGAASRAQFLRSFRERYPVFINERDLELIILNPPTFDAMLAAITAYYSRLSLCEAPPLDFPDHEGWVYFPKDNIEHLYETAFVKIAVESH